MKLSQTYIFLTFPDVQQQVGGSECGLYSLAFAYSLCSGKDPARLEYNQAHFHEHLLWCLRKREISDFPHSPIMKNPKKPLWYKFAVYCLCCLPNTGDSMIQCFKCSEWFHFLHASTWKEELSYPKNDTALLVLSRTKRNCSFIVSCACIFLNFNYMLYDNERMFMTVCVCMHACTTSCYSIMYLVAIIS